MNLLNEDLSYNYTEFYGKDDVVFKLIGSRAERSNSTLANTIDTFKTKAGTYVELKRSVILDKVRAGLMKPVLTSKSIPLKTYSKKEWDKLTGRVQ